MHRSLIFNCRSKEISFEVQNFLWVLHLLRSESDSLQYHSCNMMIEIFLLQKVVIRPYTRIDIRPQNILIYYAFSTKDRLCLYILMYECVVDNFIVSDSILLAKYCTYFKYRVLKLFVTVQVVWRTQLTCIMASNCV